MSQGDKPSGNGADDFRTRPSDPGSLAETPSAYDDHDDSLFEVLAAIAHAPAIAPALPSGAALPEDAILGAQISHFRVLERIGAGGMGVVYKAEDVKLRRAVALKVLSIPQRARGGAQALVDEARRAAAVAHPNIAAIYEADEVNGVEFIAMEFVAGTTLRARLARGALAAEEVERYAVEIARGLACAHAARVVHGDLKPDNVMVSDAGPVKILDFGLARMLEGPASCRDLERAGRASAAAPIVAGTPAYMAPEQVRGAEVGPAADVFAVGVLLYELLTGKLPFAAKRPFDPHRWDAPPSLEIAAPATPPELRAVVARCLALDLSARFADGAALVAALEALDARRAESRTRAIRGTTLGALGLVGLAFFLRPDTLLPPRADDTSTAPASGATLGAVAVPRAPAVLRRLTANPPDNAILHAALSPNGSMLAYADRTGLYVRPVDGPETQRVTTPPGMAIEGVAWFARSERLLVMASRPDTEKGELWTVPLGSGESHRLAIGSFSGIAVAPDDSRAVYAEYNKISWMPLAPDGDAEGTPRLLVEKPVGGVMGELAFSPTGERVAYLDEPLTTLAEARICTIALAEGSSPVDVVQSPRLLQEVPVGALAWLADGRIVYGLAEWLPAESGTNLFAVTVNARGGAADEPRRLTTWTGTIAGVLTASRDARRLAFVRFETQSDVYVGDLEAGGRRMKAPRRLTRSDRNERPSTWSRDGRGVFFFSDRSGNADILYQDLAADSVVPIATGAAWETLPQLTPDGADLLYWQFDPPRAGEGVKPQLFRVALLAGGGPPARVLTVQNAVPPAGAGRPQPWETRMRCSSRKGGACLLSERDSDALAFYELDPAKGRGREVYRIAQPTAASYLWDVSPDGTRLAVAEELGPIRLYALASGAPVAALTLPTGCDPIYPTFTADGAGLFVSAECPDTNHFRVYHVAAHEPSHLLWESPPDFLLQTEASPDGKHLAISVKQQDNDVWMLEGF